jgi:hypothetical protein
VPPQPHRPRPALARAGLVLAGAGFGAVTALAITDETASQFRAPGGAATFLGSLTGLAGTYLIRPDGTETDTGGIAFARETP